MPFLWRRPSNGVKVIDDVIVVLGHP